MAKFCPNCGNEVDDNAAICVKCGNSLQPKNSNSTVEKKSNGIAIAGFIFSFLFALVGLILSIIGLNKSKETNSGRGLSIAGIIISILNMILGLILAITGFAIGSAITNDYNYYENNNSDSSWNNSTVKENTKSNNYTLGDTITFDGLDITFDNNYSFVTITNSYSEYYNSDVIKIGANIKNISDEKNSLNMFNYTLFGSKGTELSTVATYFDESVDYAGDLKPEASYYKYFYVLYDGDGDYSIDFDNYSQEITVAFNVTK